MELRVAIEADYKEKSSQLINLYNNALFRWKELLKREQTNSSFKSFSNSLDATRGPGVDC